MMKEEEKKLSKKEAIAELWKRGNLSYLLKGVQVEIYNTVKNTQNHIEVIAASRRLGKCLISSTYIPTPAGIKQIKDLKVGEQVYGYNKDGTISLCNITDVIYQGKKEVVDLINNNKVLETCTKEHVWLVYNNPKGNLIEKSVEDFNSSAKIKRYFIDIPGGSINYEYAYTMGALLGDGCSRQGGNRIDISGKDEEIVKKCAKQIGAKYIKNNSSNHTWHIYTDETRKNRTKLTFPLYDEWCRDRYAHEKIVDIEVIKTWNRESQLQLLSGLIDTDGSVSVTKKDNCLLIQFGMQATSVVEAFQFLILQLFQYKPTILVDKRLKYKNGFVKFISIKNNLFCKRILKELDKYLQVPRKKWKDEYSELIENNTCSDRVGVKIENPRMEDCYDISIDNETHMYLTANGLVTHNSWCLCVAAIETCLKIPNGVVKYLCPTKIQAAEVSTKIIRDILKDCPIHLKPEWKEAKKIYLFPNGSEIQIGSTDNGSIENLRGGASNLCLVDEAAYCTDLGYCIEGVLSPTTDTTNGKIILASTPNGRDINHEFNVSYMLPRIENNSLIKYTIYDSPMLTPEKIVEIEERYGKTSQKFKTEYLVEISLDQDLMVFPEFIEKETEIVKEVDKPSYFHTYVSMDIGFKDLTVLLFAWYDFKSSTIVIEDEIAISGPELTTEKLAALVREKEQVHFKNSKYVQIEPYLRVSDTNNPILLNDLYRLHAILFSPTAKDNKDAAINEVRLRLQQKRIVINPRCINLRYHLRSCKWDKKHSGFSRVKEDKKAGLLANHSDAVDALIYLVRNVQTHLTPYPSDYGLLTGENVFAHPEKYQGASSGFGKVLQQIVNSSKLKIGRR